MAAISQNFLFRHRDFGLFWAGMALVNIAAQIEAVTIGWQIYALGLALLAETLGVLGLVSHFLGPVGAAVSGGIGTMIVTGAWAWMFPALRKADRLDGAKPDSEVLHPHAVTSQVSQ